MNGKQETTLGPCSSLAVSELFRGTGRPDLPLTPSAKSLGLYPHFYTSACHRRPCGLLLHRPFPCEPANSFAKEIYRDSQDSESSCQAAKGSEASIVPMTLNEVGDAIRYTETHKAAEGCNDDQAWSRASWVRV